MGQKGKYRKEELINAIVDMRLTKSMSMKNVLEFLMNDLGYGQAMAYNYIRMAQDIISENYKETNRVATQESAGQIEEMMQYSMNNKNFKLWFELRKELNKVNGVYAAQKMDITTGGDKLPGATIIYIEKPE